MTPAPVYLVRHAKAGNRANWTDEDRLRPLTKAGRRQAEGLIRLFDEMPVARITSSPHVRCVQTIRPLALDRRLPVVESDAWAEGASVEGLLGLIQDGVGGGDVFCSHGDVIPALVLHLAQQGMTIRGERDWKKGSTWILERGRNGTFTEARYLPPA